MVLSPYERHPAGDEKVRGELDALQDNIVEFTDKLVAQPGLDSIFFERLELAASVQNWIEHGLGREFRGWRVCDIEEPATIFRDTTVTTQKDRFLVLVPSTDVIINLEIF